MLAATHEKQKAAPTAHQALPIKRFIEDSIGFVELLEVFGDDLTVANAARVSYHKESAYEFNQAQGEEVRELSKRDKGLISFLAKHRHATPFFHPQARFRIKMPIFIAREWYRHTVGFARNEMSRRYVTDAPEFYIPANLRQRDKDIKQGSSKEIVHNNQELVAKMSANIQASFDLYNKLLDQNVCPEQARTILPQSMYTEFIETASLAGYARLAVLRLDPAAQKEIRDYAHLVSELMEQQFPVSWKALINAGNL
ncbi:MAG: Thymidylate synthase, flavin-dependent [candidate division TM6 bacterium GW2011_GWF2_38_10]|nr:MAG: Thymidylate synthase, flavin-dependent [candidate division TM6 bacterium GW2011_GWF2_38_10]